MQVVVLFLLPHPVFVYLCRQCTVCCTRPSLKEQNSLQGIAHNNQLTAKVFGMKRNASQTKVSVIVSIHFEQVKISYLDHIITVNTHCEAERETLA